MITVPKKRVNVRGSQPRYVSPATKSLSLTVFSAKSKTSVFQAVTNLVVGTRGCNSGPSGLVCVIKFSLAPGTYTANIATYSSIGGKGSLLSQGQKEPFTIVKSGLNKIPITLYGVPRTFSITPATDSVIGSAESGFTMAGIWAEERPFTIVARDASGNAIVGPDAPSFSIKTSNSSFAIEQPNTGQPNTFDVTPPGTQIVSTTLSANAKFSDPTVCNQRHVLCKKNFGVTYNPFALDDWVTFAHDFQRTGLQTQSTGITAATVSQLRQRWKVTIPDVVAGCTICRVYGSPVVYDGNVIVPSYNGTLYDFSATDGSIRWKTKLTNGGSFNGGLHGSLLRATPVIDTADGLVLIGTWRNPVQPSALFALHLSDGSPAWTATVGGAIRAAPVYANGVVYEGWAGGDEPYCVNGGVSAFNAQTGALQWTWLTNPVTNPNGGGGIWGALAWDGSHLIFGTGNVCGGSDLVAQGAVALNPDGSTAWSFQVDPDVSDDDDTGGGVLIQNGIATFINKNGSLYSVDAGTGHRLESTPMGAARGEGGFATPTSDGSITVVGAGFIPTSNSEHFERHDALCWNRKIDYLAQPRIWNKKGPSRIDPGFGSLLEAVDSTGSILWSLPMTNTIDAYSAIAGDVVFAPMDQDMDAVSISSGSILTAFPAANVFEAGAVIVPSGLYMVDYSGDVYALSLPGAPAPGVKAGRTE